MDESVGFRAGDQSRVSEPVRSQPAQGPGRKKGTACTRCRSQKIRCDHGRPSCGNCSRAGRPCVRVNLANNPEAISYIAQVESRLRSLEDSLRRVAPEELERAPAVNPAALDERGSYLGQAVGNGRGPLVTPFTVQGMREDSAGAAIDNTLHGALEAAHQEPSPANCNAASASPSASAQIEPSEPLAHEVGLLSLANSKESKYLGPSSGVWFARLIFSAVPHSRGPPTNWAAPGLGAQQTAARAQPFAQDWVPDVDLQNFVDAYFDTYHPLYPFLDEDAVADFLERIFAKSSPALHSMQMPRLSEIEAALSPIHFVQILLIIALGATILETRLSSEFLSERYLATAMMRIDNLALHDSIEGLQTMLLLTLSSLSFENGPNAWFLTSNIIASCLDMGLQRQWIDTAPVTAEQSYVTARKNLRRGIFWSAYSLERTLAVVLGRPLTLRDEAIDIEFPGESSPPHAAPTNRGVSGNPDDDERGRPDSKRTRVDVCRYTAAQYSFQFDRIIAEVKLMLYRVARSPDCFPWPTDIAGWQNNTDKRCHALLNDLLGDLKWRPRRGAADNTIRSLELKYHHCLMLLHRPSPAIPRPIIDSWKATYNSAVKTILIHSDLHRFSKMTNSWLTAHTIFISGITFLYCLWVNPQVKDEVSLSAFTNNATACSTLLKFLGRTWSVAADALVKFERLVHLTSTSWKSGHDNRSTEVAAGHSLVSMSQSQVWQPSWRDGNGVGGMAVAVCDTETPALASDLPAVGGEANHYIIEPESFYGELGDMGTWFDLDWIVTATYGSAIEPGAFLA